MERPGERSLLMLAYVREHPGCRPQCLALLSGAYGTRDADDPRQRRVLSLAAGSLCGLMVKAGLARREENPTRLWITTKGLSTLTDAAERERKPPIIGTLHVLKGDRRQRNGDRGRRPQASTKISLN